MGKPKTQILKRDPYQAAKPFNPDGAYSCERDLRVHLESILRKGGISKKLSRNTAEVIIFHLVEFGGHDYFRVERQQLNIRFRNALDILVDAGYLTNHGFRAPKVVNDKLVKGEVTRYSFTKTIVDKLQDKNLKISFQAFRERPSKSGTTKIVLKDHYRFEIIEKYIDFMKGTHLRTDKRVIKDIAMTMTLGSDLESKGRLCYGLQNLRKAERQSLTIDGEATTDMADAKGCHIRFLYAMAGYHDLPCANDAYTPPGLVSEIFNDNGGFNRKLLKVLLLTALNAKDRNSAIKSMLDRRKPLTRSMLETVKGFIIKRDNGEIKEDADISSEANEMLKSEINRAYDALLDYHSPIKHFLTTPVAGYLQFLESEMMICVIKKLTDLGIKSLPVHDGIIVKSEDRSITQDILNYEMNRIVRKLIRDKVSNKEISQQVDEESYQYEQDELEQELEEMYKAA